MCFRNLIAGLTITALMAGAAQAAVITGGVTEGRRDLVVGTTVLQPGNPDATPTPNGAVIGPIGANEIFGVYGRIVGSQDIFELTFSTDAAFDILFDFDGYTTEDTRNDGVGAQTVLGNQSGLMSVNGNNTFRNPDANKRVTFTLTEIGGAASVLGPLEYTTNINADSGDSAIIFGGIAAGNYSLEVDGKIGNNALQNKVAFYDLNISTVPLPASVFLLLAALGGLGLVGRRRSAVAA